MESNNQILNSRNNSGFYFILLDIKAQRADGLVELLFVDGARLVFIPRAEEIDDARRRARERVLERPQQILLHIDLAGAVLIQRIKALLELFVGELARRLLRLFFYERGPLDIG